MSARLFTLIVGDKGARLLDGAGGLLLELGDAGDAGALSVALPAKARVQLILAGPGLDLQCLETPALAPRECAAVRQRLAGGPGRNAAHALDPDPLAEGGHVLWVAAQPRQDMDRWTALVLAAGARPVFATPWQRALLAAARQDHPSALYLALEPGRVRLLFCRGRNLRFTRSFPLPADLDPATPAGAGALCAAVGEELSLVLQFISQKHRGPAPSALFTIGLPASPAPVLEPVGRALGLALGNLAPDLEPFLLEGAGSERRAGRPLDLIPVEVREARSRTLFRAVVRTALAGMILVSAGAKVLLLHHEAALEQEAVRAEAALAQRRALAREGEAAARLRFGLLRLRWAEDRQRRAMEQLERLGVRIFQAPGGVELRQVAIAQEPGDELLHRFKVEGTARTGPGFSLGAVGSYYSRLAAHPGLKLEPLQDVAVLDGSPDQALTRFTLGGTAP